jgi:hypothetical protein
MEVFLVLAAARVQMRKWGKGATKAKLADLAAQMSPTTTSRGVQVYHIDTATSLGLITKSGFEYSLTRNGEFELDKATKSFSGLLGAERVWVLS